jgi:hypothetical protein
VVSADHACVCVCVVCHTLRVHTQGLHLKSSGGRVLGVDALCYSASNNKPDHTKLSAVWRFCLCTYVVYRTACMQYICVCTYMHMHVWCIGQPAAHAQHVVVLLLASLGCAAVMLIYRVTPLVYDGTNTKSQATLHGKLWSLL